MKEMKDTKRWLGPIPKNWEYIPGKYVFHYRSEKGNDNPVLLAATQKNGMYPQDLLEGVVKVKVNTDLQQFQTVHKNDYVISLRSFQGGFEMSDYEGVCSPAYQVFFNQKPIDHRYYKYLFKSTGFIQEMDSVTVGIREGKNIPYANFGKTFIPYPSLDEQSRIAAFLDSHIAKIDDSIARYKVLSDMLDEYRKAVITKAVTQGIRGKRPMKDSSVSWIECIPEEWNNSRLKALFRFGKGLSITKENLVESGYPVISYGQIHAKYNNGVSIDERLIRFVDEGHISESSVVGRNDMIFADTSEDLEGCGNCVYIDTDSPIYGGYHTIILRSNTDKSNKYIAYLCKTDMWRCQIRNLLTDVKLFSISQKVLKNTTIILPPEDEQAEIVAYLDKKCSGIDNSKAKIEAVVKKLEEYKKSLIYNAVTGKIEC